MMKLKRMQRMLRDKSLAEVAKACGLHYNTVRNIRDNPDANPTMHTMQVISAYLLSRAK